MRVKQFKSEKRENDFDGKRAAIDEVAIEEERIVLGGHSVQLEDVDQIEELAVDIAADAKLGGGVDRHVHHRRLGGEILFDLQQDLVGVLPMQHFLLLEVFEQSEGELFVDGLVGEMRPRVGSFHLDRVHVGVDHSLFPVVLASDGFFEGHTTRDLPGVVGEGGGRGGGGRGQSRKGGKERVGNGRDGWV